MALEASPAPGIEIRSEIILAIAVGVVCFILGFLTGFTAVYYAVLKPDLKANAPIGERVNRIEWQGIDR